MASAATGANGLSKAGLMAGTALGTVGRAAVSAASDLNVVGAAASRAGIMMQAADAHVTAYKASLAGVPAAANAAKSGLDRLGAAANDNINRLQSTPGNIAAQFQDIGVTAAGGMSPLLIALQQGTQLSSAMAGGLRPLLGGILQLLSPVTLLTIALVGLAAAGLQSIDWMSVGQSALNGLANALEVAAPYAAALGATLLLAFAPQIIAGIYAAGAAIVTSLIPAMGAATGAMLAFAIANPFTAIVLAIGLVVAALYGLSQVFGGVFSDIIKVVYDAVNSIIAGFVGAFNGIKATWRQLPAVMGDIVFQTANAVINGIEFMVNRSIAAINLLIAGASMAMPGLAGLGKIGSVSLGDAANPYAGAASSMNAVVQASVKAADKVDYIGAGMGKVRDLAKSAAGWLRGMAAGLGAEDGKGKKGKTPKGAADPKGPKPEKTIAEKFDELLGDASKQMRALNQAGAQIGIYGEALAQLKYQQELFNAAQDKGIPLIDEATGKLNAYGQQLLKISQTMAAQNESNRRGQFIEDMALDLEAQQRALNQSRAELGLTGAALAAYRFEQELLNKAIAAHITLTQPELDAIKQAAQGYGEQSEAIRKVQEQIDFARDTVRGFFNDFFDGLREGQSLIKSFGESVLNTLNRIIDKLLNTFLDNFLNNLFKGGIPGLGGIGSGTPQGGSSAGVTTANAMGNAFGNNGIYPFARGGIVSSPTLFAFGKGGSKLGIMGEAGDEAILPLKRGPDGSLGVQGGGNARGGTVIHAPIQVQNDYHLDGAISPETIVRMIQQGGARTKQEVERGLMDTLGRLQRDGATV